MQRLMIPVVTLCIPGHTIVYDMETRKALALSVQSGASFHIPPSVPYFAEPSLEQPNHQISNKNDSLMVIWS
jgi:hypothetical protein